MFEWVHGLVMWLANDLYMLEDRQWLLAELMAIYVLLLNILVPSRL